MSLVADDVVDYLGGPSEISWEVEEIEDAIEAETAAQADRCRVPETVPAPLRQALLRRVARNLALRRLPLGMVQGDDEGGSSVVLPSGDPRSDGWKARTGSGSSDDHDHNR